MGHAMTFLMRYSAQPAADRRFEFPETWPTPRNRRARARSRVHRFARLPNHRGSRAASAIPNDATICSRMLMDAMDEDGSQMTPQQLRDETMTLFLAGHETTAQMLAWTWYLLSAKSRGGSAAARRIAERAGRARSRKRPISAKLPYLQAVMNESLRLYPPAYIMARTSIEPVRDRRLRISGGHHHADVAMGDASRCAIITTTPDEFRPSAGSKGLRSRLAGGRIFSLWRRPAALHRAGICAAGSAQS